MLPARSHCAFEFARRGAFQFVRLGLTSLVLVASTSVSMAAASSSGPDLTTLRLAYLDPGSGSFVVQALIAMFAGVAVTVRLYWHKIKAFLGLGPEVDEDDEDLPPDDA